MAEAKPLTVREALLLVLDQVDYKAGACGFTEMVGACLPAEVIDKARQVLAASGVAGTDTRGLSEGALFALLMGCTEHPPARLPPGYVAFARAVERAHGIGVQAVPAAKVSRVRCSATNLRGGNCGCAFGQCKKGNIL